MLTTYDANNPDDFGVVVATAKWYYYTGLQSFCVFAPTCLDDNHALVDDNWYRKWTYTNITWARTCSIPDTSNCYYGWVPLTYAESENRTEGSLVGRYLCQEL